MFALNSSCSIEQVIKRTPGLAKNAKGIKIPKEDLLPSFVDRLEKGECHYLHVLKILPNII
jgi:hypothetical protein